MICTKFPEIMLDVRIGKDFMIIIVVVLDHYIKEFVEKDQHVILVIISMWPAVIMVHIYPLRPTENRQEEVTVAQPGWQERFVEKQIKTLQSIRIFK